jgi:spore maturation protein CgeB
MRILYVATGLGFGPYLSIDSSIYRTLQEMALEVSIIGPTGNILDMALSFRPDLVLVCYGVYLPVHVMDAVRSLGFKTAVWFTDDPFFSDDMQHIAPHYDYVFTMELNCVSFYQSLGCPHVYYLPLGMDPGFYHPKPVDPYYHSDICFIGTGFQNRVHFFEQIAPYLATQNTIIVGQGWERMHNHHILQPKIRPNSFMLPEELASYYNGAKIVINIHRNFIDTEINRNSRMIPSLSVNPRTFEISGCRTLQLTDVRYDLARIYSPGMELATYESPGEMIDKINHFLANEGERQAIANAGLSRTLQEHTYRHRLSLLLDTAFR